MGRRSQHKPDELRKLILDAAQAIIEKGGVAELSAREIGRAIGYAPGTLYNMYDNLDEILLRVEVRVLEDLDRQLADDMDDSAGADALRNFASGYVAFAHKRPSLWRLLSEHNLPTGVAPPVWYAAAANAPVARLEQPLSVVMPDADRATLLRTARALWASIHGMTVLSTNMKLGGLNADASMVQVVDVVETFVAGIAHRKPKRMAPLKVVRERATTSRN
jgi:AcrR family transcriptional regulator